MQNVLQKNQSYPELGYRIDGNGIAYDLETGQPLPREAVDARIAQAENTDPSSNDYAERERKRGGMAGLYDRNKQVIVPAADVLATALTGGVIPPGATSAAIRGLDQEGKRFASSFDPLDAAKGYAEGWGANKVAGAAGNAISTGARVAEGNGLMSGIREGAKTLIPSGATMKSGIGSFLGGGPGGLTAKDWLGAISGGVGAGLDYKTQQAALEEAKNRFARTQAQSELGTAVGAQDRINRAPMADNAQALLMARMGGAPTTFAPRDFTKGPINAQGMAAPATGGPQDALASARTAAAAYRPGQGGVNTSALELLKKRMFQNARVGA